MRQRLTTKEVIKRFGIAPETLKLWLKAGCPKAGKRKLRGKKGGRPANVYDVKELEAWVAANGRLARGLEGEAVRDSSPPAHEHKHDEKQKIELIKQLGMMGYLERVRQQEVYLFQKFSRLARGDASGNELSAVARALSTKGEELRRAEMTALEHQQKLGELVKLSEAKQLFVSLASACRERIMSLPNELAPVLRDYLRSSDDTGNVRDELDRAIRHALMSLPDELPEIKG
jgi:hypothetical protein